MFDYDEWFATGERPSNHPIIRYCCGYVEHLCELFNDPSYSRLADKIMTYEFNYLTDLTLLTENDAEKKLVDKLHPKYIPHPVTLGIERLHTPYHTIRSLRQTNSMLWLYSLVRHILEYNSLTWRDRLYVSYWMTKLSTTQLSSVYTKMAISFRKHVSENYLIVNTTDLFMIEHVDYPAHREEYLCNDVDSLGLGCYVQAWEKRLSSSMNKFIENIYSPLLNSDVDTILICIDPLEEGSSKEQLLKMESELLDFEKKTISNSKTFILIPREHVNATVGRNIMFSFIRTHLRETLFHWMGADDDDKVLKDGVNQLRTYIIENGIKLSKILLYDEHFKNININKSNQAYKRYAPWTYAFSPEYYNGLSYRCIPMEKEDLDFFNRLMQYKHNAVVISTPVYKYNNPNGDHPKNKELFETGDVIDYMNVHNAIESKNSTANNLIAPTTSSQKIPVFKYFYLNNGASYHYRENHGATHYGMSINGYKETQEDDVQPRVTRKSVKTVKDDATSENFNGDMYIILYDAYSAISHLTAASFQNGKHPRLMTIKILPKSVSDVTGNINETFVEKEMDRISPRILELFEPSDTAFSEEDFKLISQWNEYYLKTYRTEEHIIPLRTFGGKRVSLSKKCLFIAVLLLMVICLFILPLLLWR